MIPIFVSYATEDRALVNERIIPILQSEDFSVWIDHGAIVGGEEYQERIKQGLDECRWYLIVLTPNSENSEFVMDELDWAIKNRSGRIVPVMLKDCDPYDFHMRLPRLQYVDFRTESPEAGAALRKVLKLAKASDAKDQPINITHHEAPRDDLTELVAVALTLLPRPEQKHLRNLSQTKRLPYVGRWSLRNELRHLCDIGAIERKKGRHIGELESGAELNLADLVQLTRVGELLAKHVR